MPEQVLLNAVGGPQVIINEALDILCEDALKKAIDESDIKAVGQAHLLSHPETLIGSYKPGEPIIMELSVDVYPEVRHNTHTHKHTHTQLTNKTKMPLPLSTTNQIKNQSTHSHLYTHTHTHTQVTFTSSYKGLKATCERIPLEDDKVKTALDALRKKRVRLLDTEEGKIPLKLTHTQPHTRTHTLARHVLAVAQIDTHIHKDPQH